MKYHQHTVDLLLELNPDATIRDLAEFSSVDYREMIFREKQKKIKERAEMINRKLSKTAA